MIIDLRSDTVTKPTPLMLEAMMQAKVGDDVYEEDETVNELQQYAAKLFGKEASLFCPSGTMANQIAIKLHTQPGDELLCADNAHVYKYEGGGVAVHSGVQIKLLKENRGQITATQIAENINAQDVHFPSTKLVCIENTSNRGGGSCYSLDEMNKIAQVCKQHHLAFHLDGARIFNAIIAANYTALQVGNSVDSISVCLSKGLGAPVGSLLIGTNSFIAKAKRVRKVFGGGMRQAGFLAAAGLYALHNHIDRLAEDHLKAKRVAAVLLQHKDIKAVMPVETNIVIAQFKDEQLTQQCIEQLAILGIKCGRIAPDMIRMVVHLDISNIDLEILLKALK